MVLVNVMPGSQKTWSYKKRTTLRSHKVIQYLKVFCKMQSAEFSIGDIKSIDEDLTGYQSCYYLLYISSFLSEEVQDTDITEG